MGSQDASHAGAYVHRLASEARRRQRAAREAFDKGDYTRASALIGDAELLAEDVHDLVCDMARCDIDTLTMLAAFDVRNAGPTAASRKPRRLSLSPRGLRFAIGSSLAISLALSEF